MFKIVGIVLLVLVGWQAIKIFVGASTPPAIKGRTYFANALVKCGVSRSTIQTLGDAYLNAVVAEAIDIAEAMKLATKDPFTMTFCRRLDHSAALTAQLLREGAPRNFPDPFKESVVYQELRKRDLIRS